MSKISSLKGQAVAGLGWAGLSTLLTSLFQYVQVAALTKFLSPSDFGIMAMALVVIGLAQAYTDMGISNAIIQRQDTTKKHLSSLYWLEIAAGLGLFILMILATPPTVWFFRTPRLTEVMLATSVIFLITPLGQQFQILMQKGLEFKGIALIEVSSSLASTALAIIAAYLGFGVMALVIASIAFYAFRSLQYLRMGLTRWRPTLHFNVSDLKGYLGFGLYQMGERTVTYLSINVINLIIGRYLGSDALGHYSLAYQLIVNPIARISVVIMTVAFPIFSRLQKNNAMLREGYLQITRFVSFSIFPILVLIFFIAPVFVPVILGQRWGDVIPLIQILCVVGLFRSLGIPTVPTYLAKGRADLGFIWNFLVAIVDGALFYFTARYGIIALTLSFAVLSFIQIVIMQAITGKMIGLRWSTYLGSMARETSICIVMGFILYGTYAIGRAANISQIALFSMIIVVFIMAYVPLALAINSDYVREIKRLI